MSDTRGDDGAEPIAPASPVGRLRRAITRLNQRALRFTRPGSRWFLASVKLGFINKAALILFAALQGLAEGSLSEEEPPLNRGIVDFAILAIVFAPVFETLGIMLVHLLTRRWIGVTGFVAVSTVLAYVMHGPPLAYYPAGPAAAFLIMSYQYVSFRDTLGIGRAFAGVTISHAVSNGITVPLLLAFPD